MKGKSNMCLNGKLKMSLVLVCAFLYSHIDAQGTEYRTGGKRFSKAWEAFYVEAFHESDIDDPLIKAGKPMVPAICEAIANKDMKRRRYAIGALGHIGDKKAIPILSNILKDSLEVGYFRGDALQSLYRIDRALGKDYARQFQHSDKYIEMIAKAIQENKNWLTEPTGE